MSASYTSLVTTGSCKGMVIYDRNERGSSQHKCKAGRSCTFALPFTAHVGACARGKGFADAAASDRRGSGSGNGRGVAGNATVAAPKRREHAPPQEATSASHEAIAASHEAKAAWRNVNALKKKLEQRYHTR